MTAAVMPLCAAPALPPLHALPALPAAADCCADPTARPLLDRWFLAWAERAEARWRRQGDLRARYY